MADENKLNQNPINNNQIIDLSEDDPIIINDSEESIKIDDKQIDNSTKPNNDIIVVVDDSNQTISDGEILDEQINKKAKTNIEIINDDDDNTNNNTNCNDIEIKFKNQTIADLYKLKFINFIKQFIEFELNEENDLKLTIKKLENIPITTTTTTQITIVEDNKQIEQLPPPLSVSKKRKKKSKTKTKRELFIVDAQPSINTTNNTNYYTSKFTISGEIQSNSTDAGLKNSCFNCDKNHALKDCPEPKDFVKINVNRQKFSQRFNNKQTRYHLEDEQKYQNLQPGRISDKLRHALGLRRHELPNHIYLMRKFGYPPGWLEEAKIIRSNLNLYGLDDKTTTTTNTIHMSTNITNNKQQGLDPTKIVDFPGFNVPLNKGFKDDYRNFGVPPYSNNFSKEAMLKYFDEQLAKQQDNLETCDMDIDDNEIENNEQEFKTRQLQKIEDNEITTTNSNLLTLNELEIKKKALLDELNNENTNSILPTTIDDDNNKSGTITTTTTTTTTEVVATTIPTITTQVATTSSSEVGGELTNNNNNNSEINNTTSELMISTSTNNKSKEVIYGTPILKSNSPYYTLPNLNNFSKDVTPIINFENLPNSTGKYEKMSDVLQKVRNTLKKLPNS